MWRVYGIGFVVKQYQWSFGIKIGQYTFALTLFIAITGWALHPPLMILLATNSYETICLATLDNDNPWNDKLRMIRYDEQASTGSSRLRKVSTLLRISLPSQHLSPQHLQWVLWGKTFGNMQSNKSWIVGSFDGLFYWDRKNNVVLLLQWCYGLYSPHTGHCIRRTDNLWL